MRVSTGACASSTRSYSMKPVTFPISFALFWYAGLLDHNGFDRLLRSLRFGDGVACLLGRVQLAQRTLVFNREHLDEPGPGLGPTIENVPRAQTAGPLVVVLDQLLEQG